MAHTIATVRFEEEEEIIIIDSDEEKEIAELRHTIVQATKRKRIEYAAPIAPAYSVDELMSTSHSFVPHLLTFRLSVCTLCPLYVSSHLLLCRSSPNTRRSFEEPSQDILAADEPPLRRLRSGLVTRRDVTKRTKRRTSAFLALERLQDDLIVEIFTHLEKFPDLLRVRQVCKRWYALSCEARLWRNLSFEGHENIQSVHLEGLCQNTSALRQLRNLSLARIHGVSEDAVRAIPRGECAATLEVVNLSWCSGATDKSVVEFSRCPGLRELRVSHCRAVSRRSVRILAVRCPRLEVLDLNNIAGVRDSLLEVIGKNCPRLRVLSIANARNVSDEGVSHIAKGCPLLQVLDMSWCCKVTDWAIAKVANAMPRLREVGLSETRVTDYGVAELTTKCRKIESVHLARCVSVSNKGAECIIRYCSERLTTLNLASCHSVTDDCVERLITVCPKMICLDVSKLPCRALAPMLERVAAVRDIQVYF
jgi:F-box-like